MNPILVEVLRGDTVESLHRGAACIVDAGGKVVRAWGDADMSVCPRSAIKPFQTIPLIDSGAAAAFNVSDEEIALSCASHSGEPVHVEKVAAWLKRLGLSEKDLTCGAHAPSHEASYEALIRAGKAPTRLHNNCSGKHTGFLALAKHLGAPTASYVNTSHVVQKKVFECLGAMTGCEHTNWKTVCDGCSAPNVFLPLRALALGWAKLGASKEPAEKRIVAAMKAHPILVSGHGRPCAAMTESLSGMGIVKTGAEGVYTAALPEQGLGIAVKIDDGAGRAAVIALVAILDSLKAFKDDARTAAEALKTPPVTSWAGELAGVMRPAKDLT